MRRGRMVLSLAMAAVLVLMPFSSAHAASYKASPKVSAPKAAPKVYGSKSATNSVLPKLEGKAAVKAMNARGGFVRSCGASKSLRTVSTVSGAGGEDRRRDYILAYPYWFLLPGSYPTGEEEADEERE